MAAVVQWSWGGWNGMSLYPFPSLPRGTRVVVKPKPILPVIRADVGRVPVLTRFAPRVQPRDPGVARHRSGVGTPGNRSRGRVGDTPVRNPQGGS